MREKVSILYGFHILAAYAVNATGPLGYFTAGFGANNPWVQASLSFSENTASMEVLLSYPNPHGRCGVNYSSLIYYSTPQIPYTFYQSEGSIVVQFDVGSPVDTYLKALEGHVVLYACDSAGTFSNYSKRMFPGVGRNMSYDNDGTHDNVWFTMFWENIRFQKNETNPRALKDFFEAQRFNESYSYRVLFPHGEEPKSLSAEARDSTKEWMSPIIMLTTFIMTMRL
jgi:hypothetical protein